METFVMLTSLSHSSLTSPLGREELEHQVMQQIRSAVPKVEWVGSYAILGPYDYLDIFHAPDIDSASKVAAIVRTFGHARTEVWGATEWEHFKKVIRDLPPHPERKILLPT